MKMAYLWFFRDSGISDTNNTRKDIAGIYRNLEDIETSNVVEKHGFLAKTTSKLYTFRLFILILSVILYNFWMKKQTAYDKKSYARKLKNSTYVILYSSSLQSVETLKDSRMKTVDF